MDREFKTAFGTLEHLLSEERPKRNQIASRAQRIFNDLKSKERQGYSLTNNISNLKVAIAVMLAQEE